MQELILFRGLPGSGKSTLASRLCDEVYSADMYFEKDGNYDFDLKRRKTAHKWCQEKTEDAMKRGVNVIGVANTFTKEWEMEIYFELAKLNNYRIHTLVVENRHGSKNVHEVPEEVLKEMRSNFNVVL